MKKILFILALLAASGVSAIDRFVDPNLGSGNGTTLFTTITSAVNAAVNGDRILIVAGTYNEPTLTLNKSLVIIPQVAGTYVNYNGNITIGGFPGMNLSILGFRLGIYSVTANAITGGSASNRATVNIVDSRMTNLTIDQDYYELNCARCQLTATTTYRYGNFIVSKTNNLYVLDEPSQNLTGQKILIANDTILNYFEYRNDDYVHLITNNLLRDTYIFKWNSLNVVENKLSNNYFQSNSKLLIARFAVPNYNFNITSNEFGTPLLFFSLSQGCACGGVGCIPGSFDGPITAECGNTVGFSTNLSLFPDPNVTGYFKWTYNGIDLPCTVPTGSQPLVLTKIIGTTGTNVNTGNPNHDYYDIDLTINDRGRTGGPYSILNYNPTFNPSNGKAYVFDLEIPADLFPGQQIDIKAKGYHRN
jgi:hypothetical protein